MALVTFHGGAADGQTLEFQRTPIFLRVVKGIDGKFDVLDQLDDDPGMGETIHIYRRGGVDGHVCTRGQGCIHMMTYHHTDEISPEGMEDRETWRAAVAEAFQREEAA